MPDFVEVSDAAFRDFNTDGDSGSGVYQPDKALIRSIFPLIKAAIGSGVVDLADYMDIYYGAGNWTYRTTAHTGSDATPAMEAALTYLRDNGGRGTVVIPPSGPFRFTSEVDPTLLSGNYIVGRGSQASKVIYDKDDGILFRWSGAGGYTGGGCKGLGILLEQDHDTSTAVAIYLGGDATYQPDQTEFDDLYVTTFGSSYWYVGFWINGQDRTSPQGCRIGSINQVELFRCSFYGAAFVNAVGWTVNGLGIFVGTGAGADFVLSGGGAANTNSVQVYLNGCYALGNFNFTNASHCSLVNSFGDDLIGNNTFTKYIIDAWFNAGAVANPFDATANTFRYNAMIG